MTRSVVVLSGAGAILGLSGTGTPQAPGRTPHKAPPGPLRCPGAEDRASRTASLRASGTTMRSAREGGHVESGAMKGVAP
jgi:hypothetical protein